MHFPMTEKKKINRLISECCTKLFSINAMQIKKREIYGNANNPPAFTNPVHGKLAGWIKEDKIANT